MVGSSLLFRMCSGQIFLVRDLLEPIDDFAVERLLDGDMAHSGRSGGPVPVLLAGRTHDNIAGANFPFGATPALHPTAASSNDQPLTEWMGVPGAAGAWLEGHQPGRDTGRIRRRKQRVDPH